MSFFGTDGIRGRAGEGKLSDDNVRRIGRAVAQLAGEGGRVVIGRDTRNSGKHMQDLLSEELVRNGVSVTTLGVVPTPATAWLTTQHGAALGIMITASHNPWHDNGVKIFSPDGRKLSDTMQSQLEAGLTSATRSSPTLGMKESDGQADTRYADYLLATLDAPDLSNLTIVTDGANGAAHVLLPEMLKRCGATVIDIGETPNGRNINTECGSTSPSRAQAAVVEHGADIGFALDGDADRIVAIDETGRLVNGDQIVARLAADARGTDRMESGAIVSTVMANLGLERWAETEGLTLHRTKVGDRHVAKRMDEIGATIGGEPSGHILLTDIATTGDGCLTALHLAASLAASGEKGSDWLQMFEPVPQTLKSVRFEGEAPLARDAVKATIAEQTRLLDGIGRVLVRPSGTEPVIRVMAEGDDAALVSDVVEKIGQAVVNSS